MSAKALQATARGSRRAIEAAAAALDADLALEALTYSLIAENEDADLWRIDAYPASAEQTERLQDLADQVGPVTWTMAPLADEDWLALALSGLPPVRAGRFFVCGAHDLGRAPVNAVRLRIEAGAAFGTGHHGTTVGCLLALERLRRRRRPRRVLDVGAGTGVLAIAATACGAHRAIGCDIDPVSVRVASENARLNGSPARFVRADGPSHAAVRGGAPYDLIFANILAGPLARLAPAISAAAGPGATLILSGLLRGQARFVLAAYVARGWRLEARLFRDAWATLILRRR